MIIQRKAKTITVSNSNGENSTISTIDKNDTDVVSVKYTTKIRYTSEDNDHEKSFSELEESFHKKVEELKGRFFIFDKNTITNVGISRNNLQLEKRTKLSLEITASLVDCYNFENIAETVSEFAILCMDAIGMCIEEFGFEKY